MKIKSTAFLVLTLIAVAAAQNYRLPVIVFDQGGQRISAGNYLCHMSIGQQVASATIAGGRYLGVLGFWHPIYGGETIPTGLQERVAPTMMPQEFALGQCHPNPFQTATQVTYVLPRESEVDLRVLDVAGRTASVLVKERQKAGSYRVTWDVSQIPASRLPNGIYFCRLQAGEASATRTMVKLD